MNRYSDLVKQKEIIQKMIMNLNELRNGVLTSRRGNYVEYIRLIEDFFTGLNSSKVFQECDGDPEMKQNTFDEWYEVIRSSLDSQVKKINEELEKFERVKDGIEFLKCMKQKFIKNCDEGKEYAQFATGLRIAYMDIKQQNQRLNIKANDEAILELLEDMENWLEAFMDMKSGVE